MLRILGKSEILEVQKKGYMCEHLLCLYSTTSDQTALYNNVFPVFINGYGEADVILFGLGEPEVDRLECVKNLTELPINTLNIVSPVPLLGLSNIETKMLDLDFHINVNEFDFDLEGNLYKNIRNRLRHVEKLDYQVKISRKFTKNHKYLLSRHMARHKLDVWDYEELLFLDSFISGFKQSLMMEAYRNDKLVGFDVVDFFEKNRIMVVPIGVYLEMPMLSDFMMHENLKFARDRGYDWLDVGVTCGRYGLESFKKKWFAEPKFKIYVQTLNLRSQDL